MVHLVADDPDLAAAAGGRVVGAALSELLVAAAVGNGAGRLIAVVQPAKDAQPLVAPRRKILAAVIVGLGADRLGEHDPARFSRLEHLLFPAGIVHPEEIG
jgi:hypothetical protein